MDTNTIIELFEELRKQLTSLSRRIDDRNISAPAPHAGHHAHRSAKDLCCVDAGHIDRAV